METNTILLLVAAVLTVAILTNVTQKGNKKAGGCGCTRGKRISDHFQT